MLENIKNLKVNTEALAGRAQQAGFIMMALATGLGIAEIGDHRVGREALLPQPVLVSEQGSTSPDNNPLRREREEAGPHYVSYAAVQRTPGRTRYYS